MLKKLLKEKGEKVLDYDNFDYLDYDEKIVYVFSPAKKIDTQVISSLSPSSTLISYNCQSLDGIKNKNITYFNPQSDAEYKKANSVITAEGGIELILSNTSKSLYSLKILVLGYGFLGKEVSRLLKSLSADVSVATYDDKELSLAKKEYKVYYCDEFLKDASKFDVVVNTIPCELFSLNDSLKFVSCEFFLDLASVPCISLGTVSSLPYSYVNALRLPDKVSPKSACLELYNCVHRFLYS